MTSRFEFDPFTRTDALGFPLLYKQRPNEYDAYFQALAHEMRNLRSGEQNPPGTEPPQSTSEAVTNAILGGVMRGWGHSLRAGAVFGTTLPWVGPMQNDIAGFPQMTPEDQKSYQHRIISDPNLTHDMKARVMHTLTRSARSGESATLDDLGAYDPDQSGLMQAGRFIVNRADQAFPISRENEHSLPVRTAGLFSSALAAVPGLALGPPGFAALAGLQSAGGEDERAQSMGATLPQRVDAAGKKGAMDSAISLVPLHIFANPSRPEVSGWLPLLANKWTNTNRMVAANVPLADVEQQLASRISRGYDPEAHYETNPTDLAPAAALAGLSGFAMPSGRRFTEEQKTYRDMHATVKDLLSDVDPENPLLKTPSEPNWL